MKSIVVLLLLSVSVAVHADEYIITQDQLKFSTPLKVIKPGDRVIFSNVDNVVHNIISQTNGFQFDLGPVKPGMRKALSFKKEGVVDVECTVHPGMTMTLFVR